MNTEMTKLMGKWIRIVDGRDTAQNKFPIRCDHIPDDIYVGRQGDYNSHCKKCGKKLKVRWEESDE